MRHVRDRTIIYEVFELLENLVCSAVSAKMILGERSVGVTSRCFAITPELSFAERGRQKLTE